MQFANIKDNYVSFNGFKYFRRDSLMMSVGYYGEKKGVANPAGGYLNVKGQLYPVQMNGQIHVSDPIKVTYDKRKFLHLFKNVKIFIKGVGRGSKAIAVDIGKEHKGSVKLVEIAMLEDMNLRRAFNDAPGPLQGLATSRTPRRAVSRVLLAFDAEFADSFTAKGSYSVEAGAKINDLVNVKIRQKVSAGTSNSTTINLADGTVLAYLLANPKWKHRTSNKRVVTNFTKDQWGI